MAYQITREKKGAFTQYCSFVTGAEFTNPNIKIAIVSLDACIRDLAKGFTALSHYPVKFFDTVEEARVWVRQVANVICMK